MLQAVNRFKPVASENYDNCKLVQDGGFSKLQTDASHVKAGSYCKLLFLQIGCCYVLLAVVYSTIVIY